MTIIVTATITVGAEYAGPLIKQLLSIAEATRQEEGCLQYDVAQDITVEGITVARENTITVV